MSKPPRIYLDHAATTPILPAAKAAMIDAMERWANPSSPHAEGRAARAALEDARERIKRALGWEGELIFTSGATEAIEIALGRTERRVLVSAVEHDAVFRAAPGAEVLPIGEHLEVDRAALTDALKDGPAVAAIQHVNSETGVVQPVSDYAAMVRDTGGILMSDCSQSAGRYALPDADMIVVSAHKLGGPPGIGALLVKQWSLLEASGGQEHGYRGGTENLPAVLGFAAAVESIEWNEIGIPRWLARLLSPPFDLMDLADTVFCEGGTQVLPAVNWIAAYSMPHLNARAQLIRFDAMGFSISAGSACSSGSLKASRALAALRRSPDEADRTIRVSFGWSTTQDEVQAFAEAWAEIASAARKRAA